MTVPYSLASSMSRFAAVDRHRNAARVLEIGYGIYELRGDTLGFEAFQLAFQNVELHASFVERNGHRIAADIPQSPDEPHPGRRFDNDGIAAIDEEIEHQRRRPESRPR